MSKLTTKKGGSILDDNPGSVLHGHQQPGISFEELVGEMVSEDLELAERDALIEREGFRSYSYRE
ncbi:MAG: hypothetical protein QM808_07145 [Steroidobacteraceae bacterium]